MGITVASAIKVRIQNTPTSTTRSDRSVSQAPSDRALVEDLYLAALSRLPNPQEVAYSEAYLKGGGNRAERAQDLLWALLNSYAFLFNR